MTLTDGRRGIAAPGAEFRAETFEGVPSLSAGATAEPGAPADAEPPVHLLPSIDEHLTDYRERSPALDPALSETAPPSGTRTVALPPGSADAGP